MKNYSVKIALRGVSPMIWRRLRIPGSTSLADFHQIIQIVFGWDDDHLHLFHIYGKDYGICYLGGPAFSDDPYAVLLDDFEFDVGDRFTYEYNFYETRLHDIRIEKIATAATSYLPTHCVPRVMACQAPRELMNMSEQWILCRPLWMRMNRPRWVISGAK